MFFCGFFATKNTEKAQALNSSDISSATKIADGADFWDSSNKKLNQTAAKELLNTLFGDTKPVDYIKNHADAQEKTWTNSYVVPASKINVTINETEKQKYGYIVKLGGLDWMITSLTLDDSENPILTLYLADDLTDSKNQAFTTQYYSDKTTTKGNNMYSRSTLRTNMISGTGNYEKLAFINKNGVPTEFAKKYLIQPKFIAYQRQQTMRGRESPIAEANCPNDALETPTNGAWSSEISSNPYIPTDTCGSSYRYDAWGEDYIWIPSCTETGLSNYLTNSCIWQLSNEQRKHTQSFAWFRSGNNASYCISFKMSAAGSYDGSSGTFVTYSWGVRPAIHINLDAFGLPEPPETVKMTYNGKHQDLTAESWYQDNATIFNDDTQCEVTYKKGTTILAKGKEPKEVGTYTAEIRLKTDDYHWASATSESDKTRIVTIEMEPYKLDATFKLVDNYPKLTINEEPFAGDTLNERIRYYDSSGNELGTEPVLKPRNTYTARAEIGNKNYILPDLNEITFEPAAIRVNAYFMQESMSYNGAARTFTLIMKGDNGTAEAALAKDYGETVTQDGLKFTARNAGRYQVKLNLKNKDDYVWDSTGNPDELTLEFEITQIKVEISIPTITPEKGVTEGYKASASIETPQLKSGDTLTVVLGACYDGQFIQSLCPIGLSNEIFAGDIELDTSTLSPGTYELGIMYDDPDDVNAKNYEVVLEQSYTITVKEASESGGLIWRLMQGGKLKASQADPADTNTTTFSKKISYNGMSYVFVVNAKELGTVDTSYNSDGFINGYKTVAKGKNFSLTSVSDAGDYVTTVRLNTDAGTEEYSINWTIGKITFDLSGVRWAYDGRIPFNEKGMSVELDPATVPEGLTPDYSGAYKPTAVNQTGKAMVTFQVDDPKNYELPVKGGKGVNYKFTDTSGALKDFEWEKEWIVEPAVIPVEWTVGMITVNGKKTGVEKLAGNYDPYVKYVYYETDGLGNIPEGATPLPEPVVVEGVSKYYVAEVSIKSGFESSYILDPDALSYISPVFEAGKNITVVKVKPIKTAYPYTGQPVEFQFEITQGTITEDDFEIVYYKGMMRQVNPPKDVGSYRALIKLKSEYEQDYYIDGDTEFEYTIEKAIIEIVWNEGAKPPALRKLTDNEKLCITYEYGDGEGNPVDFGTMRTTAGTYQVRAVIKSASQKNYIFDNDGVETEWKSFEVTEEDIKSGLIVDPNDPDGNKQYVDFTLKRSSGGKGVAPEITNTAGMVAGRDYTVGYFKDGAPVGDFSEAGKYEIKVTLIGENADRYILVSDTLEYIVLVNGSDGNGDDTGNPNGDGTGNNPSEQTIEGILPVILSGVSIVLIIVFGGMSLNNVSVAKEAKKKTRRLAEITYSVAPASLLMLFGLSYTNWWIIAGVLMGVALVMAIVAFLTKNKKRKALALLEEEEARIAEEKAYAEREELREEQARRDSEMREEQARRDNEMRMMFAALQQNSQQPIDYEAIQGMISSTVSALLPAVQQIQALPPAQSDAEYYNRASAETDELRRLMQRQQEQMAAQQAQMAQQQDMINQLMQERENIVYAAPEYEEEPVDDVSWLGDGDELVSLEESYGNLTDEEKRCYYEIGSYIMNKPRTSQNDGRYAVLFKYRRRTLFKLCIIGDAPVLYYPAEGGGRGEIRILESTLNLARSVIDQCMLKVDNELA